MNSSQLGNASIAMGIYSSGARIPPLTVKELCVYKLFNWLTQVIEYLLCISEHSVTL